MERKSRSKSDDWQVVYMDLMTIMMVFFVILWSISQGKDEGLSPTPGSETTHMVNLPSDVLFRPGKSHLTPEGKQVFGQLLGEDPEAVLSFDTGGLTRRRLVIHGHTDSDGKKSENLQLGYERALAAYHAIRAYGPQVADNVTLCTHADNTPVTATPKVTGKLTATQLAELKAAKSKNRRITIEDKIEGMQLEEP